MGAITKDVRREQLEAEVDRHGPAARELFDKILADGETAEWAAMCACRTPPGTRYTDKAFCQGQQRKMENMSPLVRGMLQDRAKKSGIDTRGKYYVGGPFGAHDPRSWVTSSEDLITIAKRNNLNLEGVLNHKATRTEPLPQEKPALAPDIVNGLARKRIASDPALAEKCRKSKSARQELREQIIQKHSRKKTFRKSSRLG